MMRKVIVRFNRSGNRSNDHAERTIKMRPMPNRSIAGGEGLSSSLRSRSAGSPNDSKSASGTMTYGNRSEVIVREFFGGLESLMFIGG